MSRKNGAANDNGGGADPDGFTLYRGGRGGRGGRGSIGARTGGQGRTGGRGRRSGRALEDENRNKNQFNYLNGEAYDDEDDEDDDEENEFEDEVDLALAGKDNTAGNGATKVAPPAKGVKQAWNDDEMKEFVDALYGDEFIPESEFQLKKPGDGEDKFANEMVGVVTEIKKKRQLSIDDTVYDNNTKTNEETATVGKEGQQDTVNSGQQDTANPSGSATTHNATGHILAVQNGGTVQDEDKHLDAMEKVSKEIKAVTKKIPSTNKAGGTAGDDAECKGSTNSGKGTTTTTPSVAEPATQPEDSKGSDTGAGKEPTVILDYSEKPAQSPKTGKYAHLTNAEAKAHIQERGDKMIETKQTFLTTTKLEFNLANGATQFSVRQATTNVLLKLQGIDKTLKVKSTNDDTEWTNINTIPSDPTLFSKHFKVREENPPRGAKKIVIHFILHTSQKFNDIKYDIGIFNYLKQERIYLKVDKFETSKIATPGFLIDIHPHLTNLTYLQEIMTEKMETTRMQDKTVIEEWKKENPARINRASMTNMEQIIADRTHVIPKFTLHAGKRAFGAETSRVETVCIIIECAATDAKYLKALLSSIYSNQECTRGMFVPSGIHLMESPTVLCNLLRRHNKYLQTTSAVPIFGMKAHALQTEIILEKDDEKLDLEEFTQRFFPCIESIEPTNKTNSEGKWFIICRQPQLTAVHNYVDETLLDIYTRFAAKEDLFPGYPSPRRIPTRQGTKIKGKEMPAPPKIVGTYAAILREYSSNPQEDQKTDDNAQYNKAPDRPRKRQAVQLLFDNKEFPVIPGSTTPTQASTQATPSTVTQVVHPQISDFDAKLNAIEQRMQLQINTIHETQNTQMQMMMNRFDYSVHTMMSNMNLMMENLGKSLRDIRNPTIPCEQAIRHLSPLTPITQGEYHQNTAPNTYIPITQNPHGSSQTYTADSNTAPSQLTQITQTPHGGSQNNTVSSPSHLPNSNLPLNQMQSQSVGVGALNQ